MSHSFHPYAVRVDDLRAAVGSEDVNILHRAKQNWKGTSAEWRAFEALLEGHTDLREASVVALEALCVAVGGEFLVNDQFSPSRGQWLRNIDAALERSGVEARVSALLHSTSPVSVAQATDSRASCVDRGDIASVLARLNGWEQVEGEPRAAVEQVVAWLRRAQTTNRGLVTFFHA